MQLDFNFPFNADYIIYMILIVFSFYIGYFGIKQENIFTSQANENFLEGSEERHNGEKYKNSGMKMNLLPGLIWKTT